MTTRQADSEALLDRCRTAGWRVERSSRGYKVYDGGGTMHTVHLTYSDHRSLKNTLAGLERAGLTEAEQAIKNTRLTESRTRADVAREVAEKRGKELATKTQIRRATGPYMTEIEDVPLDWFTTPHPAPWMRWCNITPDLANTLLGYHNGDNRPLAESTTNYYRDIILAGMWHLTHQGMAMDTRALVQDGQHRLSAVVAAGKIDPDVVVPFAVFVGMPPENFKAIDEGKLRNARQLFGKMGEKNSSCLQTTVRLVYYYQDGDARRSARLRLPNQVVVDTFGTDECGYRESAAFGQKNYLKLWCSNGALGAAHYLISKENGRDNDFVHQFFSGLTTGLIPGTRTVLDDDDPRNAFREKMQQLRIKGETRTAMTQLGMLIATWNNLINSRRIRHLMFTNDSPIPKVLRCIPGDGGRPSFFQPAPGLAVPGPNVPVVSFKDAAA